jgi:phosphoribosylaminoimidazolecarboxamide formyltransferase / IMP cyclohydrolase
MMSSFSAPAYSRYVFVSVWDKTHIADFCQALQERFNYGLIATGGTRTVLEEAGLDVVDIATITGFPEILGGRVKSLHPTIFAGILARRDAPSHMAEVQYPIDIVVCNLYPFEQGLADEDIRNDPTAMIELVDIGGVSLLRAAAKNFASVAVVSHPQQYEAILADVLLNKGSTTLEVRKRLALAAFQRCSSYDNAISGWLATEVALEAVQAESTPEVAVAFPPTLSLTLHHVQEMRYGENPHQPAALYALHPDAIDFQLLHGKPLSYNNIMDMEAAWNLICEFNGEPAVAIIKHNQPCGVALGATLAKAYERALDCDPLSAFGGVVALNRPVDEATAKLMVTLFTEVIIAPGFEAAALEVFKAKKNLRLVERAMPHPESGMHPAETRDGQYIKQVSPNLMLVQQHHHAQTDALLKTQMKVLTKRTKPTKAQLEDAAFAWKVVKHLKSNAIVVAHNGQAIGLSGGQTSRVGAVEQALAQACDGAQGAVLASDGFFPAVDNVQVAAQNRVSLIIQPAGSIKDAEVIQACEAYGMAMVATGVREFKH